MGKKNRIAAAAAAAAAAKAAAASERCSLLRTANTQLVKEAAEYRNQIKELRFQLASKEEEIDISHGIERYIVALVLSSGLREDAARRTEEMAAATLTEWYLMKKTESAIAGIDDAEMQLLAVVREKDAKEIELAELKESLLSMEQARELGERRRKWLCLASAATLIAATAVTFFTNFKK